MIRTIANIKLDYIDYQVTMISSYKEAKLCKVLIIDEHTIDELLIKELFVSNPKVKIILISDNLNYYKSNIDFIIPNQKYINPIIHNLDSRHKIISRVQIKEDFNKVSISGEDIRLTPKEMLIYSYLNNRRGQLCLRKDMLVDILGYHESSDTRLIDVYVKHLRTKLGNEGSKIETIRGKGYIYND